MKHQAKLLSLTALFLFAVFAGPSYAKGHDKDSRKEEKGALAVAYKGMDTSNEKAQPTEPTKRHRHEKSNLDIPLTADFFVTAY